MPLCDPMLGYATFPDPVQIDLVYSRPLGSWSDYETRLLEVAGRFCARIHTTKLRPVELARRTRGQAFISSTLPSLVLLRGGEVIGQAIGDLPAREIHLLLDSAVSA